MNKDLGYTPNIAELQQYLNKEQEKSTGSDITWWSLPAGMSSIRILPPWDPTGRIALAVYMHPIEYKDPSSQYTKYNWTCLNKTFGKPCNICEGLQGLADAGVDVSKYEASRRQFYFNALVMHDPSPQNPVAPGTHVVLRAPKTLYDWVISQITNPMIGDITSLKNGIDVYVTKSGTGLGTTYTPTLSPNGRTEIPQEYLDKIDSLYNLDDIFNSGFDNEQVNKLVGSLRNSAGVISNTVSNAMNQMAAPITPIQNVAPSPVAEIPQTPYSTGTPIPPTPATIAGTPQTASLPAESAVTAAPSTANSNLPKCYGSYNAANVQCVVCPHEIQCSKEG